MREKRIRGQEKSEPLFDYNLDLFDPDEPFTVDYSNISPTISSEFVEDAKKENICFEQTVKLLENEHIAVIEPEPVSNDDPLNPEYFIGHHRRMEKEERRMQLLERQQLMIASLKVKQQIEMLQSPDWKHNIGKIVKIHNFSDENEITRKRELAIHEMTSFLEKLGENHRRTNRKEAGDKIESNNKSNKKSQKRNASKSTQQQVKSKMLTYNDFKEHSKRPTINIRPYAFGGMLPARIFPPTEYQLPPLLILEAETSDLVERLRRKRCKLNINVEHDNK